MEKIKKMTKAESAHLKRVEIRKRQAAYLNRHRRNKQDMHEST